MLIVIGLYLCYHLWVFEKLISNRVVEYVEKFELLSPEQFGFRKNFGTEYAILDIHEKLLNNLDNGLNTCSIFLDLAKAFDSVSHDILLRKLYKYGIRGSALSLFTSYLSSRPQCTKINNVFSSSIFIKIWSSTRVYSWTFVISAFH